MNAIETLKALRDRAIANRIDYLGIARNQDALLDGSGDFTRGLALECDEEIAALTKAMQAVEKLQAVRDYCESTEKAYIEKARHDSSDKRCFDLASACFNAVLQEIAS